MSLNKKLDDAYMRGIIKERARILWLMDDERTQLRKGLDKVILVEAKRHAMQVKIQMAVAIFEKLKFRMIAGDEAPMQPDKEPNICPKCGAVGYRYAGSCPNCDDVVVSGGADESK